jgi:GH3 auxin-responsive promoter
MNKKECGSHEWMIEFYKKPKDFSLFCEILDQTLKNLNSDYEAKRHNDITLSKPIIHIAKENLFYDWLKSKNKLGGQNKVPRLSNERKHLDELLMRNQN